jgi:hypothetical protein
VDARACRNPGSPSELLSIASTGVLAHREAVDAVPSGWAMSVVTTSPPPLSPTQYPRRAPTEAPTVTPKVGYIAPARSYLFPFGEDAVRSRPCTRMRRCPAGPRASWRWRACCRSTSSGSIEHFVSVSRRRFLRRPSNGDVLHDRAGRHRENGRPDAARGAERKRPAARTPPIRFR